MNVTVISRQYTNTFACKQSPFLGIGNFISPVSHEGSTIMIKLNRISLSLLARISSFIVVIWDSRFEFLRTWRASPKCHWQYVNLRIHCIILIVPGSSHGPPLPPNQRGRQVARLPCLGYNFIIIIIITDWENILNRPTIFCCQIRLCWWRRIWLPPWHIVVRYPLAEKLEGILKVDLWHQLLKAKNILVSEVLLLNVLVSLVLPSWSSQHLVLPSRVQQ